MSTPLLWRFVRDIPAKGDEWAAELVGRLTDLCGTHLQAVRKVGLNPREAQALSDWLAWRSAAEPEDREEPSYAVPLLVLRGWTPRSRRRPSSCSPRATNCCWPAARRALRTILEIDAAREYVVSGRRVPSSWIWRKLSPAGSR